MMTHNTLWKRIGSKLKRGFLYAVAQLEYTPPSERVSLSVRSIVKGHYKVTYHGVPAQKCPFDYVLYQMIINEVKPDLIIEVGTNNGGGSLYLADLLELEGKGIVHTIDIEDRVPEIVKAHPRIKRFLNGWQGYDVAAADGYETILVIEDGSHTYEDTIGALKKLSPLVSLNSYLIVEDGIVSKLGVKKEFNGGPLKAIREFLSGYKSFVNNTDYSDFFGKNATFNVRGYLKRIN